MSRMKFEEEKINVGTASWMLGNCTSWAWILTQLLHRHSFHWSLGEIASLHRVKIKFHLQCSKKNDKETYMTNKTIKLYWLTANKGNSKHFLNFCCGTLFRPTNTKKMPRCKRKKKNIYEWKQEESQKPSNHVFFCEKHASQLSRRNTKLKIDGEGKKPVREQRLL